jgi:hypothetical protein
MTDLILMAVVPGVILVAIVADLIVLLDWSRRMLAMLIQPWGY